jgi:hypothetical protein
MVHWFVLHVEEISSLNNELQLSMYIRHMDDGILGIEIWCSLYNFNHYWSNIRCIEILGLGSYFKTCLGYKYVNNLSKFYTVQIHGFTHSIESTKFTLFTHFSKSRFFENFISFWIHVVQFHGFAHFEDGMGLSTFGFVLFNFMGSRIL